MATRVLNNTGGLSSDRVRAGLYYSRKRRLEKKAGLDAITGTAPVLGALADGNNLSVGVTFGTYDDSDSVVEQMRLGDGPWLPYVGTTEVSESQVWRVREVVTLNGFQKIFTSNSQEVTA